MIYFVRAGRSRVVKIGYSKGHPSGRLLALQTGCPDKLELIGMLDGEVKDEKAWHRRFAHLRIHGEWFRFAADLRQAAKPYLFETLERRNRRLLEKARRETEEIYAKYPSMRNGRSSLTTF